MKTVELFCGTKSFSVASGGTHWTIGGDPKTEGAKTGLKLLRICGRIADYCEANNKLYFIENPRARARWFMPSHTRRTAWYCRYGDKRAKPTDIWTNLGEWNPRKCFNGNTECHHERAPRGSKTGTQGLDGARDRGTIPEDLFNELFDIIEVKRQSNWT